MCSQLHFPKRPFAECSYNVIGANALLCLLLRHRFDRSMVVAVIGSSTGARIWWLVVRAAVGRRGQRDLQLAVVVGGAVRHHCGGGSFGFAVALGEIVR